MRLRWCGPALRDFLARWGIYGLVTALVLGAGATGWDQALQAVASWSVLPLFYASGQGWLVLPAALLQGLLGAAVVWSARSLVWPAQWADSERALPLPRQETLRSDVLVSLLVLAPLCLLYLAGAASVLVHRPAWLEPAQGRALTALVLVALTSIGLGAGLLQWQRSYRSGARVLPVAAVRVAPVGGTSTALPAWHALVLLPLWRGPARRTGATLLASAALLVLLAVLPAAVPWPAGLPWILAAWSTAALLTATRIHRLAVLELGELMQAAAALPVEVRTMCTLRSALALVPLLIGVVVLLLCNLVAPPVGLRPIVLLCWAAASLLACGIEAFAGPQAIPARSARWWFGLVVCLCLASEVLA